MKYFTEKKNMLDELKKMLDNDNNYNIDIRKEGINIDGKVYNLWKMDCRTVGKIKERLSEEDIDRLKGELDGYC